ncbi:MAG: GerAB/ArcD/ProY family transporter [Bacillota bacterium]
MFEGGRISERQAIFLIIATITPAMVVIMPGLIYKEAAQDFWLSVILVTALGVAGGAVIADLGMRFPDRNIVQYGELLVGRLPGKVIGLLFIVFVLYANTIFFREFAENLVTMFMPETPMLVFLIGLAIASAYIVRSGLEVLSRVNEILVPVVTFMGFLLVALASPEMQINNFTPVLEKGIMPVLKGTSPAALLFGETIFILMFIPYLNRPQKAKRAILKGIVISGLLSLIFLSTAVAVLGDRTARVLFPNMVATRQISIAELIERVEPLAVFIWVSGGVMKVSILYYCTVLAMAQWLNLKEYKALVLPAGVLMTVLSVVLWENFLELTGQITKILPPIFLSIEFGLPLLLLMTAYLRGKGGSGEA